MNLNKSNVVRGSLVAIGGLTVFSFLFGRKIKKYFARETGNIAVEALADKKVIEQADIIVQQTLKNPENHRLLTEVILSNLNDKEVIKTATKSINKIIKSDKVQTNLNNLLFNACLDTLHKDEFNQQINQKLIALIQNNELQRHTGDHIYQAAKYALVPKSVISLTYATIVLLFFVIVYLYLQIS